MARSRKYKPKTQHAEQQPHDDPQHAAEPSTSEDAAYAPPPGPPAEEAQVPVTETIELHSQATQASFLRLASSIAQKESADAALPEVPVSHEVRFSPHPHIWGSIDSPTPSEADLPISQPAAAGPASGPASQCGDADHAESSHSDLPRIAVHAPAASSLQAATPQQSFTISAGPGAQKLYYLWSPKHKQPNAAAAAAQSYVDVLDDGKKHLLKTASSPFADVTKQQVAREATWVPDPNDAKHSRKHMHPWLDKLLHSWQKPGKEDVEAPGSKHSSCDLDDDKQKPMRRWKLLVFLCCLVAMICYVDRAAMSLAIIPMSIQYGWSNSVKGAINSIFFVGYTVTNICGGYLATRYTAKLVLGLGVVAWSIFTILTPVAASTQSVYVVLACRCLMGAGEGVTFPAIQHLQGKWLPASRRTFANTLIFAGATSGTILSYASAPAIIARFNWPGLFVTYGSLGLLWCMFWIPLVKEEPAVGQGQYPSGEGVKGVGDVPWEKFARSAAVWAIFVAQCTQGVMHFLVFLWIPSYYNQNYGIDIKESALLSIFPWACAILATLSTGAIADFLSNHEVLCLTHVRKLMQGIGSFGPAGCLFYLAWLNKGGTAAHACVVLSIMLSLEGCYVSGAASNHLDLSAKFAGIIFGLTNGLSSIVEAFSIYGTGLILDSRHSWPLVFEIVAGVNILGGLFYICFASSKPQSW